MDLTKKPYEISLWEDILTFVYQDGEESQEKITDGHGKVVAQYYKERLICVIGSDTMNTPIRAFQPKLVSNINGENTFTFNMYLRYYDDEGEEYFTNPFIGLLVNERKVKLRYGALGKNDTKWYDLIIKNVQENSENNTVSYTAKNLFVNELSKSGFNLEFNQELENNTGNINYLANEILKESDWKLKESGEVLKQTVEEPLYVIKLNKKITLRDMEEKEDNIELNPNTIVYVFYNSIVNKNSYVQLLYAENYEYDDDYVITNSPNWYLENVTYNSNGIPDFASEMAISDNYRGRRLVRKIKTEYDSTIGKYVNVYKDGSGKEIYGYTETEYISAATVCSYVTNPNSYESYSGWETGKGNNDQFPSFDLASVPDIRDVDYNNIEDYNFTSCLKLNFTDTNQVLYNSGIIDHRHHIDGFVKDEKYVFRIKYGKAKNEGAHGAFDLQSSDIKLTLKVAPYTLTEGKYEIDDKNVLFSWTADPNNKEGDSRYINSGAISCKRTVPYSEMIQNSGRLGIFIQAESIGEIYIEDVQFFPYVNNGKNKPLLPEEIQASEVRTIYLYYEPDENYKSIDEVRYVYRGDTPSSTYEEAYNDITYEKIRSITASESNRFNLIQDLCEIFECWPKFEIEHDLNTGIILLDENYRQKKWVSFHEYIGQDNQVGFKYGINLKSIRRTIESDGIVSKLIVKNNSNEFAQDGFCSIARADESPNGENFILDFSYYIQQGMMGMNEITNDLYFDSSASQGYIGYYKNLRQINTKRDNYIKEQSGLLTDISSYQASLQTYTLSVNEANNQYRDKLIQIESLTGYTFEALMNDKNNEWWQNEEVTSISASLGRLKSVISNHQKLANDAQNNLNEAQNRYEELNRILTSRDKSNNGEERLLLQKQELHDAFYKKYSRFLQEGSWISEDYIDDNLYYLDAQSTLVTSSKPKIVYDIFVLELSQLEGYDNYTFNLGDKTTIEDTEFFGWVWRNNIQTPYQEEIVVTELTIMLDSPEQNQIKVQNYKTQFEDLFQRMAATTQSVEYSTGKYQKISSVIEDDGTINIVTLQNSINKNALILQNSKDQSVVWDDTGITTTSSKDPANVVRIVNGGVFLSTDGGINWYTGITGEGINANYITSGQLNVEEINVLNGSFSSFRWDTNGISAYKFELNSNTGNISTYNPGIFVRLDQYGLYGINGYSNFNSITPDEDGVIGEDKIWKYSNFALTWKGFQIKSNKVNGGYLSITSENDLQVFDSSGNERVKLGFLQSDDQGPIYGLRLTDSSGAIVMTHSSDGKVWIRNELKVGNGLESSVTIGYLEKTKFNTSKDLDITYPKESDEYLKNHHQVINAANKFIVHDDGSIVAEDGIFRGIIYAEGGEIGGVKIEEIINTGYEVAIEVQGNTGTVFETDNENKTLIATLYKGGNIVEGNLSYQWYKDNVAISGANENTLTVNENEVPNSSEYTCKITKE